MALLIDLLTDSSMDMPIDSSMDFVMDVWTVDAIVDEFFDGFLSWLLQCSKS